MAFVVADVEVKADFVREQLLAHVQAKRLSAYAVPELARICLVAEIPKTSVGKINKKLLRESPPATV
ncbi:long-chain-fatty-acid--CoA ligase [compost metagenome]